MRAPDAVWYLRVLCGNMDGIGKALGDIGDKRGNGYGLWYLLRWVNQVDILPSGSELPEC